MTETPSSLEFADVEVRNAEEADLPALQRIYARHVLSGLATFEETAPSIEEMAARRRAALDLGLPYLVAEAEGAILGYCYAAPYRSRPAYRYAIEDSIYVADGLGGKGVGTALLGALIARCEAGPWRQMLAVIGDGGNLASIGLHLRFGFELIGTLRAVGFKFGQWVDTPIMQRALGAGGEGLPAP